MIKNRRDGKAAAFAAFPARSRTDDSGEVSWWTGAPVARGRLELATPLRRCPRAEPPCPAPDWWPASLGVRGDALRAGDAVRRRGDAPAVRRLAPALPVDGPPLWGAAAARPSAPAVAPAGPGLSPAGDGLPPAGDGLPVPCPGDGP